MTGRSGADGLTNGTMCTMFINNTQGALGNWHYSEAMQRKWRTPHPMGRTKERTTETLQPYKVGKPMTCGIAKLSKSKRNVLAQSTLPSNEAKGAGEGKGEREYNCI